MAIISAFDQPILMTPGIVVDDDYDEQNGPVDNFYKKSKDHINFVNVQ